MVDPFRLRNIIHRFRETECIEFKSEDPYVSRKDLFVHVAALINSGDLEDPRYIIVGVNDPQTSKKRQFDNFKPLQNPKSIEARNQSLADTARASFTQSITITYEEVEVPSYLFLVGVYDIIPKRRPVFTKGIGPDRDPVIWVRRAGRPGLEKSNPDEQCRLWREYISAENRRKLTDLEQIDHVLKQSTIRTQHAFRRLLPFLASESEMVRERVACSLPAITSDCAQWAPWLSGLALWDGDEFVRYACARAMMDLPPTDRRFLDILTWMCRSGDESPRLRLDIVEYLEKQPGRNIDFLRSVLVELEVQQNDGEVAEIARNKLHTLPYSDAEPGSCHEP